MSPADPGVSSNERLELREEFRPLFRELRSCVQPLLDASGDRGVVIGIAGESGSGKSVTSKGLERELVASGVGVCVLHQDDYFRLPPRVNHEHRCASLANVGPHEVQLALMQSHIAAFRERRDRVSAPCVDYAADAFRERPLDFSAARVLIVEGTYVLMLEDIDLGIFLEATHEDTRERRRMRNRDIDAPIVDRVLEIEHRLVSPQRAAAHVVIDRHFRASVRQAGTATRDPVSEPAREP
jgi:uridine kinase